MRRSPVYSNSPRRGAPSLPAPLPQQPTMRPTALRRDARSHLPWLLPAGAVLAALLSVTVYEAVRPNSVQVTQEMIDAAVLHSLTTLPPAPAATSLAAQAIAPSVVRIRQLAADHEDGTEFNVGSGVVVQDGGLILTNLHVVAGATRLGIVFADGFETDGHIISVTPEQDLAVVQAAVVPENLIPATLASSQGLRPGDQVVVVGHPFGIGPSVSAGVVSGLRRSYVSADAEDTLHDLIQFDAATNPGNSGGPLVNMRGEVVGIVTAIYNPTDQRFFVGIGFAVPIETAAESVGRDPF